MGDVQAHAQDAAQTDHGLLGQTGELLSQGGQDDEAGVTEHGDGDDEAGQAQNHIAVLNANELQDGQSHALGSAALLQEDAHDTAEADDHTDGAHGVAEAGGNGLDTAGQAVHRAEGHCQDGNQDRGDDEGRECVHFGEDDQAHHHHNADGHSQYGMQHC